MTPHPRSGFVDVSRGLLAAQGLFWTALGTGGATLAWPRLVSAGLALSATVTLAMAWRRA